MAAIFFVTYDNGGTDNTPGTNATITNLRFNAEDTNDQDTASPIDVPGAGTEYSYWKQVYLKCTTAPDTQVDGVEVYSDGTLGWGAGATVKVGDGTQTKTSASSAGYDVANAQEVMTNHTHVSASTDLFTYTSGSARTVSISETSNLIDAINETTDYLVLQLEVASTYAGSGTQAQETITWSYDEI